MQSDVLDDTFYATLAEFLSWMHGPRKDVVDVESGRLLTRVATATEDDAKDALLSMQAAQIVWQDLGSLGRAQVMARFSQALWKFQDEIVAMSQMLSGKSRIDANEEFLDLLSTTRTSKYLSQKLGKNRRGRGASPFSKWRLRYRPFGVIGMFTSPDWPLSSLNDVMQALVAGNAVVNFVTPQASLGAVLLHAMLVDAGMPFGLWKIIPATTSGPGRSIIPGLDMVVVLGSQQLGRRVERSAQDAGVPFKGFLQVLNTGVVCEDAKFDHAVRGIARAGFQCSGQTVNSVEVAFIQDTIFDDFKMALKDFVEDQITIGPLSDFSTTMGTMLNPKRVRVLHDYVKDAVALGAELVTGGEPRPSLGESFFEPTILAKVPRSAKVFGREFHGPMVCLLPFHDLSEITRFLGVSRHPYCTYLFTRSRETMREFLEASSTSAVSINDSYMTLYSAWQAPIQGIKDTGNGIRHGMESITQYARIQSTTRQWGRIWVPDVIEPNNIVERVTFFSAKMAVRTSMFSSFSLSPPLDASHAKLAAEPEPK
ncbi:aldehyde dehydrogenase family protein [Mobiluncus porci]|uniref:aldehyde dehydrogenase family protein n=1 Tax=Mobiluncus porci TaxID=2652278 RepID=UPI001E56D901|nr:aldehyde dehydrogenase family protein [Mobiluncus porci]